MAENVICPICKSEAEAINVGLFDGVGFRCKTHGEFEVADSALAMHKDKSWRQWYFVCPATSPLGHATRTRLQDRSGHAAYHRTRYRCGVPVVIARSDAWSFGPV
jgi:hypothetical protein